GAIEACPFDHVANEMRGRGGAAAITANKDAAAPGARPGQDLNRLIHLFQVNGFDGFEKVGLVGLRKTRHLHSKDVTRPVLVSSTRRDLRASVALPGPELRECN